MPTHHKSLDVSVVLDHVQCIDEGDGPGLAEPYLWPLFFKIDGTSVQLVKLPDAPLTITMQGMVTVERRNAGHRNLRNTDDDPVDAGEDVAIPPELGRWDTTLVPIPISAEALPFVKDKLSDLPGTVGVVCILMEEDNLPDSAALAGYNAFCSTFESRMNERQRIVLLRPRRSRPPGADLLRGALEGRHQRRSLELLLARTGQCHRERR